MHTEIIPRFYKTTSVIHATVPNAIFFVKGINDTSVRTYVTTLDGQAIPLQDLTGGAGGGAITLTSTDGSITVTGTSTSKNIELSSALQNLINNALQSGDAISFLINDAGYITLADVPTFDPINYDLEDFNNSGADKFAKQSELPANTSDLNNNGSDGTSTYVEVDELGDVATSNDYNDLDNRPTIPSISGLASETFVTNALKSNQYDQNNITFKNTIGDYFGKVTTPRTGALTFDITDAVTGGVSIVYYQDATLQMPSVWLQTGMEFLPNQINKLYFERDSEGYITMNIINAGVDVTAPSTIGTLTITNE